LTQTIQNLTKVAVTLRTGRERDKSKLTSDPVPFDFIYGVGTEGFCAFEAALSEKSEGETITMPVTAGEAGGIFGHLRRGIYQTLGMKKITDPFTLEVAITDVSQPDNRELVQAIAKAAAQGGCGGSCDCGC
jgi:hypothetical protein